MRRGVDSVSSSPFVELGCSFTSYEALKAFLLIPFIPLRLCVGGFFLLLVALINSAVAWKWPLDKPLPPWRRQVVLCSKELVLLILWCLGFHIRVRGRDNIRLGQKLGAVGVFNHVSWVDAFVMVWLMAPSGVSKADNAHIPVIGPAVRALQTVYIPYDKLSRRRHHRGGRGDAVAQAPEPAAPAAAPSFSPAASATCSPARAVGRCGGNGVVRQSNSTGAGREEEHSTQGAHGRGCGCSEAIWESSDGSPSSPTAEGSPKSTAAEDTATPSLRTCTPAPTPTTDASFGPSASSPASAAGASPAAFVVTSNVTEVLLRRVNDPGYCQPGGFPILLMAPEGTTSNGRGLLQFRTGAFSLRRPVMPICLRYRWRGLNPAWTIGNVRWHFLRLMCQFRNDLEVDILPPYRPSKEELKDPKLFASNVRRLMAACLGVPLVEASHDDYLQLRDMGVDVSWDGRRVIVPERTSQGESVAGGRRDH